MILDKGGNGPVIYSLYIGNGHSVIGNGYACFHGRTDAVDQLLAGDHASATLNNQGILMDIAGQVIESGHHFIVNILACEVGDPPGDLHPPYVVAGYMMGARFQQEHPITVL